MEGNVLVIGDEQLLERLEDEIVEEMIEESESVRLPGYFIYALLGCLVAVIGLLVAVILLSYKRRRNSKVKFDPFGRFSTDRVQSNYNSARFWNCLSSYSLFQAVNLEGDH